ncbi:hypothetical protein X734_31825 [Mesorhizobium sp. L2C084A000]|nr:hypothetical protein X734_31825 [Mesorhizobium sp. L2C084A000]
MQFNDKMAVAGTRQTADGNLVATARAVRTSIKLFAGRRHLKKQRAVTFFLREIRVRSA